MKHAAIVTIVNSTKQADDISNTNTKLQMLMRCYGESAGPINVACLTF